LPFQGSRGSIPSRTAVPWSATVVVFSNRGWNMRNTFIVGVKATITQMADVLVHHSPFCGGSESPSETCVMFVTVHHKIFDVCGRNFQ
jgi:hypothetical protein